MTRKNTGFSCLRTLCLMTCALTVASSFAHAQGFGAVRGTIQDPSGAIVRGATVNLKAVGSESTQTTHADSVGAFTINAVPIGEYSLQVDQPGFKTINRTLQITVGSAPNVELTMELSSTSSSVEVTAAATPLEEDCSGRRKPAGVSLAPGHPRRPARRRQNEQPSVHHRNNSRSVRSPRPSPRSRGTPDRLSH